MIRLSLSFLLGREAIADRRKGAAAAIHGAAGEKQHAAVMYCFVVVPAVS
jgi:hypothetical protein